MCYLNDTGGYDSWMVFFIKETDENNITIVGLCSSAQDYPETDIHFDMARQACVLQLPTHIQQDVAGNYSCSIRISNAEAGKVTAKCPRNVEVKPDPSVRPQPTGILPISLGAAAGVVLVVIVLAPVIILVYLKRRREGKR